jgi:hypothetical protein
MCHAASSRPCPPPLTYQAAPNTQKPMAKATPKNANEYGLICMKIWFQSGGGARGPRRGGGPEGKRKGW